MRLFRESIGTLFVFSSLVFLFHVDTANAQGFRPRSLMTAKPVASQNFVVYAADPILARKISTEAERFRKELAVQWLGHELPNWPQKCPITVELKMHAGGETSFGFDFDNLGKSVPNNWRMKLFGPADRVLDAVLPHEVTHTIFASHFGQPLPRWADEGACTTVEHESERKKNHQMLLEFLSSSPSRGLPFNRMFTMRNYPHDILPLYAQGYSLAKFLILQKGKRHFVDYIGNGLQKESRLHVLTAWNQATAESYNYKNLSDLQLAWMDWVQKGSDETAFAKRSPPATFVSNPVGGNRLAISNTITSPVSHSSAAPSGVAEASQSLASDFASRNTESWYARQMKSEGMQAKRNPNVHVAEKQESLSRLKPNMDSLFPENNDSRAKAEPLIRDTTLPAEFRSPNQTGTSQGTIWR